MQDPTIYCLHEMHCNYKRYRLGVKGRKKDILVNTNEKVGAALLILDKVVFKTKSITSDKEGHFMMIKEPINQKDLDT